jgi:dipeptidyl aminopeptidase/acylaminoacyl peptidase
MRLSCLVVPARIVGVLAVAGLCLAWQHRTGKAVEKMVFVKADPSMELSSIQMITDTDASGAISGAHPAPVFATTAVANVRRNVIGIMNPNGSNVVLFKVHGMDPALSPDGTKIAYCSLQDTQYSQIFVMSPEGKDERRLTNFKEGDACGPVWSPDGKKIAFYAFALSHPSRNPEIWVMDTDGSNQERLTDHAMEAAWSPDGRKITFASDREGSLYQIYVMNADGSNVRRLTKSKTESSSPVFAPDGASIAYSAASDGDRRAIFLMGADGAEPHRLVFSKHQDFCFPSWSPDGKYLAFTVLTRVGSQGIVVGEEKPRCQMWTGEYQIFAFDAEGKMHPVTDAHAAAMHASYGRAALTE